jgi:hypothetical protein
MERSLPPLVLAIPTGYLRPEFLNTSETTEFVLDFSTGGMTGYGKICESRPVQIGGLAFSERKGSYPCKPRPSNGHPSAEDDASRNY